MTNRKNRHPAFCFPNESGKQDGRNPVEAAVSATDVDTLLINPGNVSGGKLPTAIALDQCIGELYNSIEWLAIRRSFYVRFSENNCHIIAVKPRQHIVVFKYAVVDFPAA